MNSIYEIARFIKEHIDFLVYFDNLDESKANEVISKYMAQAFYLSTVERNFKENNKDFSDLLNDFIQTSLNTVVEVRSK